VEDLAQALGLTDNAVRAHLAALERDGLARIQGERRGGGKPAYLYGLTPEGEALFPKAYEPVLRELLEALDARLAPAEVEALLRAAGRGLAVGMPRAAGGDVRARLEAAVEVLNGLGGMAELVEGDDDDEGEARRGYVIRSAGCPLAAVTPGHPEACKLAETLLTEVAGVPVRECCDRGTPPRCCFEAEVG
jgi:predicted ArsR family transcriptional regulator